MSFSIPGWRYYNHAAIPTTAPSEKPDLTPIKDGSIWRIEGKKPFLVRYVTDWDCNRDSEWWYVIKDAPFDISALKSKHRYEITRALRYFDVVEILNPSDYAEYLAYVQKRAFSAYPSKYRPQFSKDKFFESVGRWKQLIESKKAKVYAAFFKETRELAGYVYIVCYSNYFDYSVHKSNPDFEKYNVNAALVYGVLEALKEDLAKGIYICDGSRAISHETRFQNYLEKYFAFRKCYCRLHVVYSPLGKVFVALFYPFRRIVSLLGRRFSLAHYLSAILKMEEISRKVDK